MAGSGISPRKKTLRTLVCGGRDFTNRNRLFDTLDWWNCEVGITFIIHGGAMGADTLAGEWAKSRNIPQIVFRPDWNKYGRAAGPLRNQRMIDEGRPDFAVIFPGGIGTMDMFLKLRKAKIRCEGIAPR
jgi:hypothetical protein